jgi:hypothetical protein
MVFELFGVFVFAIIIHLQHLICYENIVFLN